MKKIYLCFILLVSIFASLNAQPSKMLISKFKEAVNLNKTFIVKYFDEDNDAYKFIKSKSESYTIISGKKFISNKSKILLDDKFLYLEYSLTFSSGETYRYEHFLSLNLLKEIRISPDEKKFFITFSK